MSYYFQNKNIVNVFVIFNQIKSHLFSLIKNHQILFIELRILDVSKHVLQQSGPTGNGVRGRFC